MLRNIHCQQKFAIENRIPSGWLVGSHETGKKPHRSGGTKGAVSNKFNQTIIQ